MFKKVLVANRGEIASRVIRACKELGIATVAIYSENDTTALYVKKADEAYLVGPGPMEGYLNIHRLVDLATRVGAEAIHPGYGFLSENPSLPLLCVKEGITFIGPTGKTIGDLGDKICARELMKKAGVPVLPGTEEAVKDADEAVRSAEDIGYPIMVKASGGGGGRGLRVANNASEVREAFETSTKEAQAAFGLSKVFLEKYIEQPHHIEFQILADNFGNIIHLGERDCSIQRRHQKLVEISPSLILDDELRERMGAAAIKAARASDYTNAGTVEFLVDKDRNFYFLEMNTRLQVEHPITEETTGLDLVKKQLEIAAGMPLGISQDDVKITGFAMECRICSEDPKNNFMPSFGRVTSYYSPGGIGVRIDGSIYKDYVIPGTYDSLIVKLIVRGATWNETIKRMERSLDEFVIRGVKTTIPFLKNIMKDSDFIEGSFDTGYIQRKPELMEYREYGEPSDVVAAVAAAIAAHHGL